MLKHNQRIDKVKVLSDPCQLIIAIHQSDVRYAFFGAKLLTEPEHFGGNINANSFLAHTCHGDQQPPNSATKIQTARRLELRLQIFLNKAKRSGNLLLPGIKKRTHLFFREIGSTKFLTA